MKTICALLGFVLIFSLLAGCVPKESPLSQSSETESNLSAEEKVDSTSIAESEVTSDTVESSEVSDITPPPESSEIIDDTPKEDLLSYINSHGRDIYFYGDLGKAEYDSAIADLENVLDGYDKNVSMVAYSLDGKKALSYNTEERIFPASMIKVAYAFYCFLEMEKGAATLATEMVYEEKHYEIGTGDMQYSPIGTSFDMATIISKTLSISDNVGYLMMVDYFGRDGYNKWISDLGAPSLQIKPTVWCLSASAKDWAVVWREINNYFEKDGLYAEFFYNCCTDTAGNFATACIENANYSHKQGHQRSGDWHSYSDSGILWKKNSYIYVILTDAPGPSSYEEKFFADVMTIVDKQLFE
ncbi:MAG: serine hydrolase [Ruminococcaceae bacterium]|nr:serine hydrolase [Oscillospiraceae bacterium]